MSEFKATKIQRGLIELTRRVDIIRGYPYRDAEFAMLGAELVPAAREIAGEVLTLVDRVTAHYTSDGRAATPAEVVASSTGAEVVSAAKVADLCAVGRGEIVERLTQLDASAGNEDELVIVTASMGTLGSLRRLTIVLENSIADHEGLTAALSMMDDVEHALAIRRAYVEFRRALRPAESPTREQVSARLREAAGVIADLFGRDVYAELRASDRIQLHRLQDRLLAWLGGASDFDAERGHELWDDLSTYVELLGRVNLRVELVEHDRTVLTDAISEISNLERASAQVPERLFEVLASLLGRDDRVDQLLGGHVTESARWRPVLEALSAELGAAEPLSPETST
ncbi:MAG: hypothetical protein H6713_00025 [Myxococcales bacterium]|nr:hypothetical protein [Myxococcales bacterium]MCB9748368.1 hypothetical protein [Myxococcales bacterium]